MNNKNIIKHNNKHDKCQSGDMTGPVPVDLAPNTLYNSGLALLGSVCFGETTVSG